MNIKDFVEANIFAINEKITDFKENSGKIFTDVDIRNYLQEKFKHDIKDIKVVDKLLLELEKANFKKSKIVDIANEYCYYKTHLEKFYKTSIFAKIVNNFDRTEIIELVIKTLDSKENINKLEIKFIEKDLKNIIDKSFFVATQGGFSSDLQNSEIGLRTANEGDSAQFLFIARAILAGFNCSNVDVRSSRYDAIIDYNSVLLRIQIKGIRNLNIVNSIIFI